MADITIPYSFSPGTQIKSSEVNADFTALSEGAFNKVTGDTCQGPASFQDDVTVSGDLTVSGTVTAAVSINASALLGTTLASNVVNSSLTSVGTVVSGAWYGTIGAVSGANLTSLNATQLTSGTVPDARFPATLPTASGENLTALNATQLTSGTVPDARFPATLPAASGANLTSLSASALASGTVPTAQLGSGTANSSSWLRGDQTWTSAPAQTFSSLLAVDTSNVGNVGGGWDTLATYTLSAGLLNTTGYGVEIEAMVSNAANANTKQSAIYFGATQVALTTSSTHNGVASWMRAVVVNNGSGQTGMGTTITTSGTGTQNNATYSSPAETLSGTVDITVKGSGVSDSDLIGRLLIVRFIRVP